jgi:hypothetical protein
MATYTLNPTYQEHGADEDVVNILVCQIKVWAASPSNWNSVPTSCTLITEVESVEIKDSYKEVVGTAVVKLPQGAMVEKTIIVDGKDDTVTTGNQTNQDSETSMRKATVAGDMLPREGMISDKGDPTLSLNVKRNDMGIIEVSQALEHLATANDFAVGNRIQIKLGYVTTEEKWEMVKQKRDVPELKLCFTGFITGCSATTPVEVSCENMASVLRKKSCPRIVAKKDYTVNDFLAPDGLFKMLSGTGISLSDATKGCTINIGKVGLTTNVTVADVLETWKDWGIYSFMEPDGFTLRVARVMFTKADGSMGDTKEYIDYRYANDIEMIEFDWDVASDNMEVTLRDKNFLAVEAHGITKDKKMFKVTCLHSDSDTQGIPMPRYLNEREPVKKKARKRKGGESVNNNDKTKIDMSPYEIVPYFGSHVGITMEELKKEAWSYLKNYNETGIKGSVSVFGDRMIYPTQCVGLIDVMHPEKDGYYLVESVNTTFGLDGFRRELELPYRVGNFTNTPKIIRD